MQKEIPKTKSQDPGEYQNADLRFQRNFRNKINTKINLKLCDLNNKKVPPEAGPKYFQSNLTKFETSSTELDFISKVNHFNGRVFRISTGFFRDSIGLSIKRFFNQELDI